MRVLEAVCASHWAITEDALKTIQEIASRENEVTTEALEKYRSESLSRAERATRRGGVAMLHVQGPLFKRANLMVEFSGATSYDILMRDLAVALDDATVNSILLVIDSPGGEVNGVGELAKAVYAARGVKPITAYVSGMAASGGYWIASAASEIVVSDEALLGSIGVVSSITDTSGRDERLGVRKIEIVSSMAPGKRPDASTDEGRAQIVRVLDDLHNVFAGAVASYRGVKIEDVNTKFGRGGLLVGQNAVNAGMADRIGTLEGVIDTLSSRGNSRAPARSNGGFFMSDNKTYSQADIDKAVAEATAKAAAEAQARTAAILGHEASARLPTLANALAFQTTLPIEQAKALIDAAAKDTPKLEVIEGAAGTLRADTFIERKVEAGALVAGSSIDDKPKATDPAAIKSGWEKARARIGVKA